MKRLMIMAPVLAAGMTAAFLCGCETDSTDARLQISPKSVRLSRHQSQEFVVSGGYEYEWSLADYSRGELSATTGNRAVYTSRYAPDDGTVTQTITVRSYIPGDAASGTTNLSGSASVQAYVIHE